MSNPNIISSRTTFRVFGYYARLLLYSLMVLNSLSSCGVCKPRIEYRDSVRVEYRERVINDTAIFEIPVIIEKNVTRDTVSHLSNLYAKSDARVEDGFLWHSLESIPQAIQVPIEVEVHDTTFIEKASETVYVEKSVEKPLSWWQCLRIDAFWWLILCLILTNIKSILKLVKLL